ncbi:DUF6325 family protein [Nocardia takedensis]
MTENDIVGPIDYLVVEFPADRPPDGSALPLLRDLVDRDIIRVLDLAFVHKGRDGTVAGVDITEVGLRGDLDITLFAEANSGLLDDADRDAAGGALEPGCSAAILLYENRWAAPFAAALHSRGAQVVASGRIPIDALLSSLELLETQS